MLAHPSQVEEAEPISPGLFRITDAAREVGVSASALRLWERQGLIRPRRGRDGARRYSADDVARLRTIHRLRHADGLNAAAIRRLLPVGTIDAAERGVAPATLIARDPRLGTIARRPGGGRSPGAPAVDAGTSGDGRSGADGTAPAGGVASLEPADLGTRLRAARRASGLTLRGAAVASRLSPSFISALERSVSGASLAALKRLTSAYGTTVAALASDSAAGTGRLVRTPDRRIVEPGAGIRIEDLATSPTQLESQLFVLSPGTSSEGYYAHPGEEFMFLLDGRLGVWLDEAEYYELGPGDALTFPSTLPHRFRALGAAETRLLWINTPPTF